MPKQEGQATVARRAPQCSQCVASLVAAAPHIGQFKVSAGMESQVIAASDNVPGMASAVNSFGETPNPRLSRHHAVGILPGEENTAETQPF
jgi:hypothetical protein